MPISPSSTEDLLVRQEGRIAVLTLNRPERLNAISGPMLGELSAKLVEANKDPDTRCIVLTGAGRGFCAGLDLVDVGQGGIGSRERRSGDNRPPRQLFDLRDAPINVMWNIDTPVICAVNGAAAGYGMDLTLLADMRIASSSAKMAAVTAKRNVVPESGGTWLLPRLVGWAKAAELYYRARTIDAAECLDIGLVNAVVPPEELMPTAMQWAEEIADNAPHGRANHQTHDAHGPRGVLRHRRRPPDGAFKRHVRIGGLSGRGQGVPRTPQAELHGSVARPTQRQPASE